MKREQNPFSDLPEHGDRYCFMNRRGGEWLRGQEKGDKRSLPPTVLQIFYLDSSTPSQFASVHVLRKCLHFVCALLTHLAREPEDLPGVYKGNGTNEKKKRGKIKGIMGEEMCHWGRDLTGLLNGNCLIWVKCLPFHSPPGLHFWSLCNEGCFFPLCFALSYVALFVLSTQY